MTTMMGKDGLGKTQSSRHAQAFLALVFGLFRGKNARRGTLRDGGVDTEFRM